MTDMSPVYNRVLTPDEITNVSLAVQKAFRGVRSYLLERVGRSDFTDKQDGTPVTEVDVAVEKMIVASLTRDIPDLPVYGEEGGYDEDVTGTFLLIDPIDGTKSFIENIPSYTCMAVLIQNDQAVASVIYNPSNDEMYTAQKGRGAFKNGTRLDLAQVPLPHTAFSKGRFFEVLNDILQPVSVTCEVGLNGAGYGFGLVAEGLVAARFNLPGGGHIHDYAPGALLVLEAGGAIVPVKEDVYTYKARSFVACHPELESILRSNLARMRKLEQDMLDK